MKSVTRVKKKIVVAMNFLFMNVKFSRQSIYFYCSCTHAQLRSFSQEFNTKDNF